MPEHDGSSLNPPSPDDLLSRAAVVLVRPQTPENIGAAARAMANMGLKRLIVVSPEKWEAKPMEALAVRIGRPILDAAEVVDGTLAEAVAGFDFLIAASARLGKFRRASGPPEKIMAEAAPLLAGNRIALIFGPEKDGLGSDETELCHRLVRVPTAAGTGSLNLAQAVVILVYELRKAVLALGPDKSEPVKLAKSVELEGMYAHLEEAMNLVDPTEHLVRHVWLGSFRRLFSRAKLRPFEVQLIRGFCRKIIWAVNHPRQADDRTDGRNDDRVGEQTDRSDRSSPTAES